MRLEGLVTTCVRLCEGVPGRMVVEGEPLALDVSEMVVDESMLVTSPDTACVTVRIVSVVWLD